MCQIYVKYQSRSWGGRLASSLAICALFSSVALNTKPASANVGLNSGIIVTDNRCEIVINSSGTLAPSADQMVLSSQETGGVGGIATVTSIKPAGGGGNPRQFTLTFEAPTTFTSMPTGGDTGVTFEARYSGVSISNGRNFGEREGSRSIPLRSTGVSITEVTGHLIATRTGTTFPQGAYSAVGTLRCE